MKTCEPAIDQNIGYKYDPDIYKTVGDKHGCKQCLGMFQQGNDTPERRLLPCLQYIYIFRGK